ncbi:efflux RND transporter periplasmic adaptor subunit, partial [Bacillus amyloliquefaciens]|nr:efflux RND transporter periplasmic adaptor subunit [Bacillus amyloliquefaciens]
IMNIEPDKRISDTLPSSAVKKDGDEHWVFTEKDGKAKRVKVKVGDTANQLTELKEGLSTDDNVILNPA